MASLAIEKIGCAINGRNRVLTPQGLFQLKLGVLLDIRRKYKLSVQLDRGEIIAAILLSCFKKSEKSTYSLLRKNDVMLSRTARWRLKEALRSCEEEAPSKSSIPKKERGSLEDVALAGQREEGPRLDLFALLPPECLVHLLSFMPTEEVLFLLTLMLASSHGTADLLRRCNLSRSSVRCPR
jgi:hypothetical protein